MGLYYIISTFQRDKMICVPILGPSYADVYNQISHSQQHADLIELRVDLFEDITSDELKQLQSQFTIPMMLTLRSVQQGGKYSGNENERFIKVRSLAALKPAYLDLENDLPLGLLTEISQNFPEIKLIISYHNFAETPDSHSLDQLLKSMQKTSAWSYKIAVNANSSLEALRFLNWAKLHTHSTNLIAISMGSYGQISRILAPVIRSPLTYAFLNEDQQTAPGQFSVQTLIDRYHYDDLTSKTAIYGLIGDPVDQSISDVTHNDLFHAMKEDAVYVKIQVKPEELELFLKLAKHLPFRGLSVTMPLKECLVPYVDKIITSARKIKAINTLKLVGNEWVGCNTDGIGALNAIEKELFVKGKRVVIIGAGGAAKAIACEAHHRGAILTIVNRNKQRSEEIADLLGADVTNKGLDQMNECAIEGYDILINTTPIAMPIDEKHIIPSLLLAMDIKTKPKHSPFLECASKKGAIIVYGYQMFVEQALCQYDFWFEKDISGSKNRQILEKKVLECLYR